MKSLRIAVLAAVLALGSAGSGAAEQQSEVGAQQQVDPEIAKFRSAYTSGDGLSYVVVPSEKGERVFRYGDASRLAAKKEPCGYMLFTCASPHVFAPEIPSDKEARVVHAGEPGFEELDKQYTSGCHNPFVRSAIPQSRTE